MELSDDLLPGRRPLFFPVVIATIFLTIIGMSVGLVLSSRHRAAEPPPVQNGLAGQVTPEPSPSDPGPSAPVATPGRPVTSPSTTPTGAVTTYCRAETQRIAIDRLGAVGRLRVAVFLVTKTSEVYICLGDDGALYYHGNNTRGGSWVDPETTLFLTEVVRGEDDYRATASDGTTFSVNKARLLIQHKDGTEETQPAVRK